MTTGLWAMMDPLAFKSTYSSDRMDPPSGEYLRQSPDRTLFPTPANAS